MDDTLGALADGIDSDSLNDLLRSLVVQKDPLAVQLGERFRELQMAEVLHSIRFPNSITSNSAGIPDDRFLRLAPLGMPKMCAAYIESLEATRTQLPPWTSNSPDIPPEHAAFLRELGSLHTRWTSEAKSSPLAIKYVLKGFTAAVEDVMTSWKHSLGLEMSPETTAEVLRLLPADLHPGLTIV